MTHDNILLVLEMFPSSFSNKDISYFFDVHESTVKDWKSGKNKPNGANKIAFNTILGEKELAQ